MKRGFIVLVWLTVIGALVLAACDGGHGGSFVIGSGHVVTEEEDFANFTAVDIRNVFEAEIVQSDSFNITVTADDNILDRIDVSQNEAALTIHVEPRLYRHITMKIEIAMPDLRGLDLRGSSLVTVKGFESAHASPSDLTIDLTDRSSLNGDIKAGDVIIEASGASTVKLEGSASTLTVDASGASVVNLADFPVKAASVKLSDNSRAIVNASERLDPVDLSDDSRLQYLGDPAFGEVETSGTSAIHMARQNSSN